MKFEDIEQEAKLLRKAPAPEVVIDPAPNEEAVPIPGHIRLAFARQFGTPATLNDEHLHWIDEQMRKEGLI